MKRKVNRWKSVPRSTCAFLLVIEWKSHFYPSSKGVQKCFYLFYHHLRPNSLRSVGILKFLLTDSSCCCCCSSKECTTWKHRMDDINTDAHGYKRWRIERKAAGCDSSRGESKRKESCPRQHAAKCSFIHSSMQRHTQPSRTGGLDRLGRTQAAGLKVYAESSTQISLFFSRHQKKLMINYSASPFAIPAVEATSVIYLKPTNSRGIKSQTHYGFVSPFECLRAPGVYKIEVDKFSKKKVIFTLSGGSSANAASETSSLSCVTPGEQVSGGWWRRTVQSVLSSSSSAPPLGAA